MPLKMQQVTREDLIKSAIFPIIECETKKINKNSLIIKKK